MRRRIAEGFPVRARLVKLRRRFPALPEIVFAAIEHVLIPAAAIAMVAAFLAYLLDVRSVYWTDDGTLKWIASCFAAATVLIARYGKRSGERALTALYTGALVFAVALTLLDRANSWAEGIAGIVVVVLIWWFASGITTRLTWQEQAPTARRPPLYTTMLQHRSEPGRQASLPETEAEAARRHRQRQEEPIRTDGIRHALPFALLAVVVFAVGEPFLLAGPRETALRGLLSVMIFFLAGGIVAAAASTIRVLQAVRCSGGEASLGVLASRVVWATVTMVLLLAFALVVPGMVAESDGTLIPWLDPDTKLVDAYVPRGPSNSAQTPPGVEAGPQRARPTRLPRSGDATGTGEPGGSPQPVLLGLVSWMRFIAIAAALVLVTVALYLASRLRGFLARGLLALEARLRIATKRIIGLWRLGSARRMDGEPTDQMADRHGLFTDEKLRAAGPRTAVIAAYHELRWRLQELGHGVGPQDTPHEVISRIPARLQDIEAQCSRLTRLYVGVAYAGRSVTSRDREIALAALLDIRRRVQPTERS